MYFAEVHSFGHSGCRQVVRDVCLKHIAFQAEYVVMWLSIEPHYVFVHNKHDQDAASVLLTFDTIKLLGICSVPA